MEPFQKIVKNPEALFIENLIYNFIVNPSIDNDVKLRTAKQLKVLVEKMKLIINEKIESEGFDDEVL